MTERSKRLEFIRFLLPVARRVVGNQHPFLVRWAIAKAGQECGWNKNNVLIQRANNCLGIKSVGTAPAIALQDSVADGRDDGFVMWRKFDSLDDCLAEFCRMLNDRSPYSPWRMMIVAAFERVYAAGTPGHDQAILQGIHDVYDSLLEVGVIDQRGRFVQ
jgi:flagellum-specific peptidoglycan hydrolase FlgJ